MSHSNPLKSCNMKVKSRKLLSFHTMMPTFVSSQLEAVKSSPNKTVLVRGETNKKIWALKKPHNRSICQTNFAKTQPSK